MLDAHRAGAGFHLEILSKVKCKWPWRGWCAVLTNCLRGSGGMPPPPPMDLCWYTSGWGKYETCNRTLTLHWKNWQPNFQEGDNILAGSPPPPNETLKRYSWFLSSSLHQTPFLVYVNPHMWPLENPVSVRTETNWQLWACIHSQFLVLNWIFCSIRIKTVSFYSAGELSYKWVCYL